MRESEVRLFITECLIKRGYDMPAFQDKVPLDFDFIKAGIVDSLGLLGFVLELEERFGISISDDDIVTQEFRTVEGLTNMIVRKIL